MTAPTSSPSPSKQNMHHGDSNNTDDSSTHEKIKAQNKNEKVPKNSFTPVTSDLPTYFSSTVSEIYVNAKKLLQDGSFEDALSLIEAGSESTKKVVKSILTLTTNSNDDLERAIELHESIAPFYYLYGTTLLYNLEEAKEDVNVAVTVAPPSASTIITQANELTSSIPCNDVTKNHIVKLSQKNHSNVVADSSESNADLPEQENNNDGDYADDIQIAWENLDIAREIVKTMLNDESKVLTHNDISKLELDLAQIYLREGDLEKINGNYSSAVNDYSFCLKLTSSSDLQKKLVGGDNNNVSASNVSAVHDNKKIIELAKGHCSEGIRFYVLCGQTFCRILSTLVGEKSDYILSKTINHDAQSGAALKATGLPESFEHAPSIADASRTIRNLRNTVDLVVSSNRQISDVVADKVHDIKEVLDEIQETVDEAERSQDAVRQAAEIKMSAQKQAVALADGKVDCLTNEETGVTTSIGFGPQSSPSTSQASIVSDSTKLGMMVVKKKKRKTTNDNWASSYLRDKNDVKRTKNI